MTKPPELLDFTSRFGEDEGWRRWAVAVSRMGYNPSIPSIDWIRSASGMTGVNDRPMFSLIRPFLPPPTTPPGVTAPQNITLPPEDPEDAAKDLANATEPPVPNFIQPYQPVTRGFGAYGERDIF